MAVVEVGRDMGTGVVVPETGRPAQGQRYQLSLARGSVEWLTDVTLADGSPAAGGVLVLDGEGLLPVAEVTVTGDDIPGEMWAHRVDLPLTEGWYRVRLPGDGLSTSGNDGQDGENGQDGRDGVTVQTFRWDGAPAVGVPSSPCIPMWGGSILPKINLRLDQANSTSTPAKVTLLVNGVDVLGSNAPSVGRGLRKATVTLPAAINVAAEAVVQAQVVTFDAGGAAANPTVGSEWGQYASGQGGAPTSATSITVPLPVGATDGDLLIMQALWSSQPTAPPAGWTENGAAIVDSGSFFYHCTYRATYAAGMAAPVFAFAAASWGCAVILRIDGANTANAIDASGTTIVSAVSASSSTPTVTTDADTTKELALFSFGGRYAATSSVAAVTLSGGPTQLLSIASNRGSGQPNTQLTVGTTALDTAATAVPAATATLAGGATVRWLNRVQTIRPSGGAASAGLTLTVPMMIAPPPPEV